MTRAQSKCKYWVLLQDALAGLVDIATEGVATRGTLYKSVHEEELNGIGRRFLDEHGLWSPI
eukprot:1158330-Pelagomonas_calceolata.AAC.12